MLLQKEKGHPNGSNANPGLSYGVGWYTLGQEQQLIGPYTVSELQEHYSNGYFYENTPVRSEGFSDWQPLSSAPGLLAHVPQQDADYPNRTIYEWDHILEAWVPQENTTQTTEEYAPENMT
ncbi:uncharacterized protein LOC111375590 isoform X2 [Olea europaea var. sylvestris]|uniref:uncharacterized protein LOC111375590 isoform X2 n=1 Tax=Olea europaea var. sylvestris TaxID=158386 RepID=UPI000C1D6238|nr:uncharacterized protein LOC111375590 isoform X2 [Olea europaea var. sylvestris]